MLDMILGFFRTSLTREQQIALLLYKSIVEAARTPELYAKLGIADTVEGRVESIALHGFLVFRRMSGKPGWEQIGGALSDEIVADFDRSLREMGIGDMTIGKKVKKLARLFFGRLDLYWGAVRGDDGADNLETVLQKTVFLDNPANPARLAVMVDYFDRQSSHLFAQKESDILKGSVSFDPAKTLFERLPDLSQEELAQADQAQADQTRADQTRADQTEEV